MKKNLRAVLCLLCIGLLYQGKALADETDDTNVRIAEQVGQAEPGAVSRHSDPLEPMNRLFYRFNRTLDRWILLPVARAYRDHLPQPVQTGVYNFIEYLDLPVTIVNDLLQGKFVRAGKDTSRFAINTVFGVVGFIDTAAYMGIEPHEEDFDQTFGVWGIPDGPYLMLPVFGPFTLRGFVGEFLDEPFTLQRMLDMRFREEAALWVVDGVDTRARFMDLDPLLESSPDEYVFVREFYFQYVENLVRDGALIDPEEDEELDDFLDEIDEE